MSSLSWTHVFLSARTLLLTVLVCLPAYADAFTAVVVDAGHGGADPGTRWHGLVEKNLTLDVAKRVETVLKRNGVTTAMTRRTDKTVSLDARAAQANRYRSALLVSIHFNANRIQGISGYETFYRSSKGRRIAASVQRSLTANIRGNNRGITSFGYAVLKRTKGPSILIECGFISNKAEAARCGTAAHRQKLAEAIARGILRAK